MMIDQQVLCSYDFHEGNLLDFEGNRLASMKDLRDLVLLFYVAQAYGVNCRSFIVSSFSQSGTYRQVKTSILL